MGKCKNIVGEANEKWSVAVANFCFKRRSMTSGKKTKKGPDQTAILTNIVFKFHRRTRLFPPSPSILFDKYTMSAQAQLPQFDAASKVSVSAAFTVTS